MGKELDFDELHQAVNALMDEAGKPKVKKIPAEARTEAAAGSAPAAPKERVESEPETVPVSVKRSLPKVTSGRGNRGQTMDVIGPKASSKITPPSAQAKRLAPSIKPVSPTITPEKPVAKPEAQTITPLDQPDDPAQKTGQTMTHQDHTWPDTTDEHSYKQEAAAAKAEEADSQKSEESTTPFVTTKVEKRPLGAYAETPKAEDAVPEPEEAPAEEPVGEPSKPGQTAIQQPKELSPEVVAVESAEPEFHPETTVKEEGAPATPDDLRTMAIPQQYKTEEKETNTKERPVFDTKEYHPAIEAHTSGHRSNAWVMILIFVLVLGGTLAVAYFIITGGLSLPL